MEGSEQQQHSLTKPCIDDSHPSHVEDNLGLGFQSPHSPSSADHVPNLDPPSNPSSTDLADKITNVDQDVQNQEPPISDEVQNQKPIGEEGQVEESACEELLYMNTVCEELENMVLEEEEKVREKVSGNVGSSFLGKDHEVESKASGIKEKVSENEGLSYLDNEAGSEGSGLKETISENVRSKFLGKDNEAGSDGSGLKEKESASEELLYMKTVCEELENLVLEEEGKVREKVSENGGSSFLGKDHEVGCEGGGLKEKVSENEGSNFLDKDHEAGSEGSGLEENDYSKGEEATQDYYGEKSESEVQVMNGNQGRHQHPVRPGAEECTFYMRTGMCKFGPTCKFNHPPKKWNQGARDKVVKERQDYSARLGQNECKYFMSGGCKFGKACKFKHGTEKTPVSQIVDFNFLGLPIRPGERECPFYMRNGSCKYGSNCRFHHPDPSAAGVSDSGYANGGSGSYQNASHSSWTPRPSNDNNQYGPMMFPPTREVPPQPEWNAYKAPAYVAPQRRLPTPPAFNLDHLSAAEPNFFVNQQNRQQMPPVVVDELFPERPGQPECSFYLKTGTCKYKSACRFHHPKNRGVGRPAAASSSFSLSDKGLPLRPDQNICSHYSRYGICKFGPACKFDHPENYVPSSVVDTSSSSHFGMSGAPGGALLGGGGMPMRL